MLPWLENIEMEIYRSVLFCERLRLVVAVPFHFAQKLCGAFFKTVVVVTLRLRL